MGTEWDFYGYFPHRKVRILPIKIFTTEFLWVRISKNYGYFPHNNVEYYPNNRNHRFQKGKESWMNGSKYAIKHAQRRILFVKNLKISFPRTPSPTYDIITSTKKGDDQKMKKRLILLATTAICVLLMIGMTACGEDQNAEQENESNPFI